MCLLMVVLYHSFFDLSTLFLKISSINFIRNVFSSFDVLIVHFLCIIQKIHRPATAEIVHLCILLSNREIRRTFLLDKKAAIWLLFLYE